MLVRGTGQEMLDALLHEHAHILSGRRGNRHGPAWGKWYAVLYQWWEEANG